MKNRKVNYFVSINSQAPISNIRKDMNKVLIPDWYPIEPVLQDNEEVFISYDLLATNCSQCLVMETPNPSYSGSFDSCPNQSMQTFQQGQNINQTPKSCQGPLPFAGAFEGNNHHVYADVENIGLNPLDVSINSLVNRIMQNEEKEVNKDRREGDSDESDSILKRCKVFENRIVSNVDQATDKDQTIIDGAKQKTSMWGERKELSENEIRDSVNCELKNSHLAVESVSGTVIVDRSKKRKKRKKENAIKNEDSFETLLTDDTMTDLKESGIGSDSTVIVLTKKNLQVMEDVGINLKEPNNKDKESHVSEDKEAVPLDTTVKEDMPQVNKDTTRAHKVVKDAREPEESFLSDIGDASQQECTSSQKSRRRKSKKRHKDQENDAKSTSSKYIEEETQLSKSKKKKQIHTELDHEAMQESNARLEGKDKEGCRNDSGSLPVTNEEVELLSHRLKKERHMNSDSTPLSVKGTGLALENRDTAHKDKLASTKLDKIETMSSKSLKKKHKNGDSNWEAMEETNSALESKELGSTIEKEERCMKDTQSVLTKHDRLDTQSTRSKKKRQKEADSDWEAMAEMSSALENKEEEEQCKSQAKSVTANLTEIETRSTKSKKKRRRNAVVICESTEEAEISPKDKDDNCFKAPATKKSKSRHKLMLQENHNSSQNEKTKTTKQRSKHEQVSLDFDCLLEDSEKEIDHGVNISKKEQPSFDYETDKEIKGIQSKILTVVNEIVTESDFSTTNEPLKFTKDVLRLKNDTTCTIDSNSKNEVSNSKTEVRGKADDRASTIIAMQDQKKSDNAKKDESKDRKERERSKKKREGNRELHGASDSSTSSISFSDYQGVVVSKQTGTKSKKEKSISRHSSEYFLSIRALNHLFVEAFANFSTLLHSNDS